MEELHRPLAAAFTNGQFMEWLLSGALGDVLSADGRPHQVATLEPERPLTTQASSKFMFHKSCSPYDETSYDKAWGRSENAS